ncbi:MAG: ATP-binding cassette domain-containing protein [Eubacterium sp.]|nr:ATP-binding cassette domain-containing protein [Eubacterium sp.]
MSEAVLELKDVKKYYGKHKVLQGVNMTVNKGDIYGLVGKNGAGKTTLFKVVLGLSALNGGKVSIFGAKNERGNNKNRNRIGFFVGSNFYGYLNARENLEYFRRLKGIKDKSEVDRVLELVGLTTKAAKSPASMYSLGMKQRLGIANAMLGNPELLIFDEPTNGLDPQGIKDVRNMIQKVNEEYGSTIIVSSHILGELEHTANRFGIVHEGVLMKELTQEEMRTQGSITNIQVSDTDVEKALKLLQQGGIDVKGTDRATSSLEDFYFGLIGGGENA